MRRLKCWFRRHDWHTEYNHATERTTWECRRCGFRKVTPSKEHAAGLAGW
jgi:hypothetical protein